MDEKLKSVLMDSVSSVTPVIAATLVNSFYSALLLKQQAGVVIDQAVKWQTRVEVVQEWIQTWNYVDESYPKSPPQKPPDEAGGLRS